MGDHLIDRLPTIRQYVISTPHLQRLQVEHEICDPYLTRTNFDQIRVAIALRL
jgi:hypothetical protein